MGLGELEAKLQELGTAYTRAADTDEISRLRHELQMKKIKLEMHRRELEAARRERDWAHARFAGLYNSTPIAYVTMDAQGRLLELNSAATSLLGLERELVLNRPLSAYLADDDGAPLLAHIAQVLDSDQRKTLDIQPRNIARQHPSLRLLSERFSTEEGPACLSAIIDLSEQNQIAHRLLGCDDFSRTVLNALPVQLAVVDGHGMIIALNESWRRAAAQVDAPPVVRGAIGEDYLQLHRDSGGSGFADASKLVQGIRAVIDGLQTDFQLEYADHNSPDKRWFAARVTPMAGQPGCVVLANLDITARVIAQEDARKRSEALARANRLSSVGILASELAHEIAQPLTAVGQFSSTAAAMLTCGDAKPQDLAEVLLHVDSEVQRAGKVLRRLKLFMGRGDAPRLTVDVRKAVDAALTLIGHQLAEKAIELGLELPEGALPIEADKVQITQVLVNLLHNSIEAIDRADSPERRIHLRFERDQAWLHVMVGDTGPGIVPEWRESIFDLFETDKINGAGMGLAISRSIIEDHGGKLWVDPDTTAGALFHFTLPLMQEEKGVE